MPIRQINFTGRKRLTSSDVAITLRDEAVPPAFDVTHLSLARHHLPGDSLVRVEAYYRTMYGRFDLGTVDDFRLPRAQPLSEFDSPQGIRFRVKVTSASNDISGQLLAEGNGIVPVWASGGSDSLLPVEPAADLGHEVFQLKFEDGPVLQINDRLAQWRTVPREPAFVSLVYPSLLRNILNLIIREHMDDADDGDETWASRWLQFARGLTGTSRPSNENDESTDEWVETIVQAFCRRHRITNVAMEMWTMGDS